MEKEKFSLKDHLFNRGKVEKIATEIHSVHPPFSKTNFVDAVLNEFPNLELKDRIHHISDCLKTFLPESYEHSVYILLKSMPEACNPELSDDDFGDFIYAPYSHFVAKYGCTQEHLSYSLLALEEMTTRFSAEYSIRFFINTFPDETYFKLLEWTRHKHYHVRRLSSEGSRPKLPWSQKIDLPSGKTIPILDQLYMDDTRFVTRSVANHLNDISKSNPDLVVSTLQKWKNSGRQDEKEMSFIIRHALRNLIKDGHPESLKLIGIEQNPDVNISCFKITKQVKMNSNLEFSFDLEAPMRTPLVIDYLIYFRNKNGELNSKKVFKLKTCTLHPAKPASISKKHTMRQFMSTKTLYPGKHEFALQVNGKIMVQDTFDLVLL